MPMQVGTTRQSRKGSGSRISLSLRPATKLKHLIHPTRTAQHTPAVVSCKFRRWYAEKYNKLSNVRGPAEGVPAEDPAADDAGDDGQNVRELL